MYSGSYTEQRRPIVLSQIVGLVAGIKQAEPRDSRTSEAFQMTIKATGENPDYPATLEPMQVIFERNRHDSTNGFHYTVADNRVIVPLSMVFTRISIHEKKQNSFDLSLSAHGKILKVIPEVLFYREARTLEGPAVFSRINRAMGSVEIGP